MNSNNEKSRKQSDQPPELPPKTTRVMAVAVKFSSPVTTTSKTNPIINKENHQIAKTESETASTTQDEKLVQRQKSKATRRKMTEEEAIKELG
jgi:hypothetical protein